MKVEDHLELPTNTCVYERYDPTSLEPANAETYLRLQELCWVREDFVGRTVLDIGCNSGLLTMHALRLGAARVHAYDVQPVFVDFVSRIARVRNLPITVNKMPFDKLQSAEHKADIVLFMETLHWVVSQGLQLGDVIRRLAELTGELLYLEFPWSVKEPSIQKQTKLTEETYSAERVLDELTKYFRDVRLVRFMRYFGFESGSTRVLIEAREKRAEADLLAQLPKVYSLDVALSRGRNQSYLLSSAQGSLVAKLLAPESPFARIPEALCNRMFDEIRAARPKTIVTPEKWNDRYLLPAQRDRHWMIFPFVGRLPSAGKPKPFPIDFDRLIDLFIQVRRDLRSVSHDLLKTLREHRLFTDVSALASPYSSWATNPGELADIKEGLLEALGELPALKIEMFDGLCHGDLQTGNFVLDENNQPRVVDLDNFCVGPIYSDGLIGLIWRGASKGLLATFCERLGKEEYRPAARNDVTLAIAKGVAWFSAVKPRNTDSVIQEQIARLRKGLVEAIGFRASI